MSLTGAIWPVYAPLCLLFVHGKLLCTAIARDYFFAVQ